LKYWQFAGLDAFLLHGSDTASVDMLCSNCYDAFGFHTKLSLRHCLYVRMYSWLKYILGNSSQWLNDRDAAAGGAARVKIVEDMIAKLEKCVTLALNALDTMYCSPTSSEKDSEKLLSLTESLSACISLLRSGVDNDLLMARSIELEQAIKLVLHSAQGYNSIRNQVQAGPASPDIHKYQNFVDYANFVLRAMVRHDPDIDIATADQIVTNIQLLATCIEQFRQACVGILILTPESYF
jgi:hypothetical protein